ncbi:oxidoreductase family protein [Xylariaceae sp. FL0255]|nr:oxidoreductase family protein [Xylariaceae sp. FL0255]
MASGKQIFNVGVVGYGLSAKIFHIPFINASSSFTLHSILQRKPGPDSNAPADYPSIAHYTSLPSFLSDSALDVVVLSTPPTTHYAFAKDALEAGKHVFVEKPFVPSSSEAADLIALSQKHDRHICVYQNRRWDADFLTVKSLLDANKLGRIIEFETHFDRYRPEATQGSWKGSLGLAQGGTALYDLGTHLVDQVYFLFGMPKGVYAKLVNQREGRFLGPNDPDVEPDSVNMTLTYGSGMLVHVRISVLSAETKQPRFWIRGTSGTYTKNGLDPQEDQLKAGMATADPAFGLEQGSDWHGRLVTKGEDGEFTETTCPNVHPATYSKIYELFGNSLKGEGPVPVSASEASDVLKILEAARASALNCSEIQIS